MSTPNPALAGVNQSVINTLAAQAPASAPTAPAAQPAQPAQPAAAAPAFGAPAAPPSSVGSMFRKVLSLGLLSLAGGFAAEGASGPGPAAAEGFRTGVALRQQQFENQNTAQREADAHTLAHADMAMDNLRLLQLGKQISTMPNNRAQQFWEQQGAPMLSKLLESGAYAAVGQPVDSYSEAYSRAHELNMAQHTTEYSAIPDPESADASSFLVVQNVNAPLDRPMSVDNPGGGPAFVVPAGTPASLARKSALGAMQEFQKQYAQRYALTTRSAQAMGVAQIRAVAVEERERIKNVSPRAITSDLASMRREEDSLQAQMTALNKQLSDPTSSLSPTEQQQTLAQYKDLQQRLGELGVREFVMEDRLSASTQPANGRPAASVPPAPPVPGGKSVV